MLEYEFYNDNTWHRIDIFWKKKTIRVGGSNRLLTAYTVSTACNAGTGDTAYTAHIVAYMTMTYIAIC